MPKNPSTTILFAAQNFREFLAAIVEAEKSGGNGASLRSLAERLGIGLSTFKMVLDGSRNLTIRNIHVIATSLNLVKADREFFESMVLRDQAEEEDVWRYYDERMRQIKIETKANRVRVSDAKVMSAWYVPAFLIYLLDVEQISSRGITDGCFERASKSLSIPAESLRKAFVGLNEAGVIAETPEQCYHIVFERVNATLVKQRYIREVSSECHRRIVKDFDDTRAMFTAHTLSLPTPMIRHFYDEYKQLVEKYMSYSSDPKDLEVLQVCCQSVPLLKRKVVKPIRNNAKNNIVSNAAQNGELQ